MHTKFCSESLMGTDQFGRPRRRLEDNNEKGFVSEIGCGDVEWLWIESSDRLLWRVMKLGVSQKVEISYVAEQLLSPQKCFSFKELYQQK